LSNGTRRNDIGVSQLEQCPGLSSTERGRQRLNINVQSAINTTMGMQKVQIPTMARHLPVNGQRTVAKQSSSTKIAHIADFAHSNWHMFHLVLPDNIVRAAFMRQMLDQNIGLGYHYAAIHLFTMYRKRGFKIGMFPVADRVCRQIVTLPLFPFMTESDVERVVAAAKAILGSR
jgi:dTDP-4-amino-4,6-dideoxygalactose transaminase